MRKALQQQFLEHSIALIEANKQFSLSLRKDHDTPPSASQVMRIGMCRRIGHTSLAQHIAVITKGQTLYLSNNQETVRRMVRAGLSNLVAMGPEENPSIRLNRGWEHIIIDAGSKNEQTLNDVLGSGARFEWVLVLG